MTQEPLFALPDEHLSMRARGELARRQMRAIDECPERARRREFYEHEDDAHFEIHPHSEFDCEWCEGWRDEEARIIREALG